MQGFGELEKLLLKGKKKYWVIKALLNWFLEFDLNKDLYSKFMEK